LFSLHRAPADNASEADSAKETANTKPTTHKSASANGQTDVKKTPESLKQAWELRDSMIERGKTAAWTPVDYAPHVWREFEGLLLGYESRYRSGKAFDEKKLAESLQKNILPLKDVLNRSDSVSSSGETTVLDRLARARKLFVQDPTVCSYDPTHDQAGVFRSAVQLQNDLLYRVPYYLRWRAHVSQTSRRTTNLDKQIGELFDKLQDLLKALRPSNEGAPANAGPTDLEEIFNRKTQELEVLRDRIQDNLLKDVKEVVGNPGKEGTADRIEEMLSTPLLPAAQRMELFAVLNVLGKAAQPMADARSESRQFSPNAPEIEPWQCDQLRQQARLEFQLVRLVAPDFGMEEISQDLQSGQFWQECRKWGADLGRFYQELPERINARAAGKHDEDSMGNRLLSIVDARDSGRIGEEAALAAVRPPRLPTPNMPAKPEKPALAKAEPTIPDSIELQIHRTQMTDEEAADPCIDNDPKDNSDFRLHPFSNRTTSYRFALVNRSAREKKVQVQLLALPVQFEKHSVDWQEPWDSTGGLRPGFRPLSQPVEMTMPADSAPIAIPFPEPKVEQTPKEGQKSGPTKDKGAAPVVLPCGFVCAIRDTVEKTQKWVKRVEIVPLRPTAYLRPEVRYESGRGRISIFVRPINAMRLPFLSEEDPIQVSLDTEGLNPNGGTYQAKITDAESTASLSANVPHNLHDKVVVHLTVDGYPRAFTYTVPLDRDYPSIDRERSLCNVQILSPRQNTIYQSP
jgi:hypothetical protein